MQATRATEQRQDSQRQDSQRQDSQRQHKGLDERYGEIGISAVAAAVRHQGQQRNVGTTRFLPYDSD